MPNFLASPNALLIVYATGLVMLLAVGYYIVAKVRESFSESGPGASDLMSSFRESYSQGELSDEEYRTIKATLAARLRQELKFGGNEGCAANEVDQIGDDAEEAAHESTKHELGEHKLKERSDGG